MTCYSKYNDILIYIQKGNARNLPQDATSASPDFRNGLVSLACGSGWVIPAEDEPVITGEVLCVDGI